MVEIGDYITVFMVSGSPVGSGYVLEVEGQQCHVLISHLGSLHKETIALKVEWLRAKEPGWWHAELPELWREEVTWQARLLSEPER
jgi:hypothetical protein